MIITWHTGDFSGFAHKYAAREALHAGNPASCHHVVPISEDMKDMSGEAKLQEYRKCPVGHMTIGPNGIPILGKFISQSFGWAPVVSIVAACLAARIDGVDHRHRPSAAKPAGGAPLARTVSAPSRSPSRPCVLGPRG